MKKRTLILFIILLIFWEANQTIAPGGKMQVKENQTDKPPMLVLQIGISRYQDALRLPELKGSRTDVLEMKKLLTSDRYLVPETNIQTLLDEQATKKRIFDEFENHLIAKTQSYFNQTKRRDAVVMFQFSGHGSQVPDRSGDEDDGKDETLVTYDSQDLPNKNFDISDDEIFELTKRLNQYTDNIVYILDSCHSGSGTRDTADARRLPPRKTVPVPVLKSQTRSGEQKEKDSEQTDLLPPGDDYIVISAARSEQLAQQKYIFVNEQSKLPDAVFGYLTFYLIEGLKNAKPNTSYDELMEDVRRKVESEKPTQTPILEGDGRRYVFSGLSRRKDAGVKILEVQNRQILLQAGAMQGLTAGTILDVFNANEEKIAAAKVTNVAADRSAAEIVSAQREITTNDRALFVSPDLGAMRLKALLDGEDEAKLSAADKKVIQALRRNLTPKTGEVNSREISLATGKWNDREARWDVALLKDNFGKVFPDRNVPSLRKNKDNSETLPSAEKQIFYLAGRDFMPLYGFYVEVEQADAAERIGRALAHLAHLRAVKAIANNSSRLKGKITITPVRLVEPKCVNGRIVDEKRQPAVLNAAKTAYQFNLGERFWLEIANHSKQDLYVALLNIGSDGSVKIHFPPKTYIPTVENLKLSPNGKRIILGEKCQDGTLMTTPPAGSETFKIIATTQPIERKDFEFLEIGAINQRGEIKSLAGFGDWTTAEINFEISAVQKPQL